MPKITVQVDGLKEAVNKLMDLHDTLPDELEAGISKALSPVQDTISDYPPRTTSYKRTGLYGRSVGVDVTVRGYNYEAKVGPSVNIPGIPYAKYVRGEWQGRSPAWMHKFFWESITSIGERMLPDAIDTIREYVESFVKRVMGQ